MMLNHRVELHVNNVTGLSKKTKEQLDDLMCRYRYTYTNILYPTIPSPTLSIFSKDNTIPTNITTITYDLENGVGMRFRYCWLHRVFSECFHRGGRFYGAPWQFIGSELRDNITIDGDPTIELDYSGLHLRMLYHLDGIDYEEDPYAFGEPQWRRLYKSVALIMINSTERRYSTNAIKKEFKENGFTEIFGDEILDKDIIKEMVTGFENNHQPIRDHFFSDAGIKLQYIDSQITSCVLNHFVEKDIPVLPVHDSYVVPSRYSDELQSIMLEAYECHLGFRPVIG